ncbi:MAG: adenylate cyclase [Thermodesulfobacteriota bacterium]|nr:MAG: adenylate cyclase [Thermodesulfobacteriota bacterium]
MNLLDIFLDIVREVGLSGFLDILFISIFIYAILVLFKQSKARLIITGIFILSIIYILAQHLNLVLTTTLLHAFFAVIIVAIIVIFQEEIRRFFEQIAVWSLNPKLRKSKLVTSNEWQTEILVDVLSDLAMHKVGALIVLPGKNNVLEYLEGGEHLNGKLSEGLLKSIFDPHSTGHDGAVFIDKGTVEMFGTHLPLSKNFSQLKNRGTRHAAALGMAEVSDALCLVVSEERGTISIARSGVLKQISTEELKITLQNFYNEINPPVQKITHISITRNYREKIISLFLAVLLWFVFVHESRQVYRTFEIPIAHTSLPKGLKVSEIEPQKVKVTFLGPKRDFYFMSGNEVDILLKIPDATPGEQDVTISKSNISFPDDLSLENIDTEEVKVRIEQTIKNKESNNSN